jgi:hypothetical protein
MCLFNYIDEVEKTLLPGKGIITCYKILFYHARKKKLISPFYSHLVEWKPGEVKSNSAMSNPNRHAKVATIVRKGIHVFRKKLDAVRLQGKFKFAAGKDEYPVIVKLAAQKQDLLGASKFDLAFTKVSFSKDEYKKALNQGKQKHVLNK